MATTPGSEPGLTFVIPHRIGILAAEGYLREVLRRGIQTHVVCPAALEAQVVAAVPSAAGRIRHLEHLAPRHGEWLHKLHGRLTLLFERQGPYHNPRIAGNRSAARGRSWRLRLGDRLSRVLPKVSAKALNRWLNRLFSALLTNPFPTRRIVVVTYPTRPYLLCARRQTVYTVIESWDHPIKKSAGFTSQGVVAWNQDLGEDWRSFQGAGRVWVGFPMKLRYAFESASAPPRRLGPTGTVLYAVGTTSLRPDWYADELRLIREVCIATRNAGWRLIVKPKPNGSQPGLHEITAGFEHVTLGSFAGGGDALDYYLDAGYNARRLEELGRCHLVLNAVTTFCLDAAAAGWPVLQLDLTGNQDYPALANAMNNYHLQRYILDQPALCLRPQESVVEELARFLLSPDDRPDRCGNKLRRWLTGEVAYREAVARVVDHLLADDGEEAPRRRGSG